MGSGPTIKFLKGLIVLVCVEQTSVKLQLLSMFVD